MNEIQGYCRLTYNAVCKPSICDLKQIRGKILRVLEFASDNGALVLTLNGEGIAMVEPEYIAQYFKCSQVGEVLCPPAT